MRAIAIFLVIGHHAAYRFPPESGDLLARMLRYSGWIGVDIFFAISGFMITGILIRDRARNDIAGFFVRRFYRIVPIFVVAMLTFTILSVVTGAEAEKLVFLWSPALLLNGWTIPFIGFDNVPYGITWSLSVEETAYLLLGLASLAAGRRLQFMLLSFLSVSILLRIVVVATDAFDLFELYFFVPARLDAIALGGVGALGWYGRLTGLKYTLHVAAIAMVALIWSFQYVPLRDPVMPLFGYAFFGLVCAILVTHLGLARPAQEENSRSIALLPVKIVARFGKLSYFIYLFHLFVLAGLMQVQDWAPDLTITYWSAVSLTCAITFGLASISWRSFENPLIRHSKSWGQPRSVSGQDQPAED